MTPAQTDACQREITVEVPAEVVERETESVIQKFQKMARLPGFRRGKVPASIVRQRFAEDVKSEVVEALVPKYFRQEVEKQGLLPVSQPRVSDLHLQPGAPLRFKASFEVLPPIEVSGYQDLRVEKEDVAVTDEELENALNSLREQNSSFTAVDDRELRDSDHAMVSLTGTPVSQEGDPVTMDEVLIEMAGPSTVREFTENLRGARAGDQRSFEVVYPGDFSDQRLAGKTFRYDVSVKAIKQKNVPQLNDDFAKEIGEFQTLDELKSKVREQLQARKQHQAEHQAKDKLVEELLRRHDFPVPDSLVDRQVDVRLERGLRALAAQGMRSEDLKKMDFSRLRAGQREAAAREVKASLILERIAERENIDVSDAELEQEIDALAKQTQQTTEAVHARLTRDGALDRIRNRIRSEKTLEYLYRRSA